METLKGSKSVLDRTFLYKKSSFKIWIVEIPYVILNLLFILPMVLNNMLLYYTIYVELMEGGGFKEISGSFYLALGVVSTIAIYCSYAQSSNEIITLVELIEKVVKTRKWHSLHVVSLQCFDFLSSIQI